MSQEAIDEALMEYINNIETYITQVEKERDDLIEVLGKAAGVFDEYAKHHAAKVPPDTPKVWQNQAHRDMCWNAISEVKSK